MKVPAWPKTEKVILSGTNVKRRWSQWFCFQKRDKELWKWKSSSPIQTDAHRCVCGVRKPKKELRSDWLGQVPVAQPQLLYTRLPHSSRAVEEQRTGFTYGTRLSTGWGAESLTAPWGRRFTIVVQKETKQTSSDSNSPKLWLMHSSFLNISASES